ncbi:MAG: UDP-2,4-diacetamido-2,4,6-trideoxy-beta-L-altropyranose hydrolase [Thermoplasmata archaeon]
MEIGGRALVIRADLGPKIGSGHVMRALALGQAWQKAGGRVEFITARPPELLVARLEREGFFVHRLLQAHPATQDWKGTARALVAFEDGWLMLDGYHFDAAYQQGAREAGASLLVVDDNAHLDRYETDILLNQNAHAGELRYAHPHETRLLLGLDYVLLRQEFDPDARPQRETPETARRILFAFGGADPLRLTEMSIGVLDRIDLPRLEATILTTGGGSETASLEKTIETSPYEIRLEANAPDVTKWMAWADVAVSSGGTTVWELAFMGVPSLVIATSPAEELMMGGLGKLGLFQTWSHALEVTPSTLASRLEVLLGDTDWRQEMTARGQRLVDGRGRDRVIEAMVAEEKG